MKLYYAPGACSLGTHVLLEESGLPFTLERLNLQKRQTHDHAFERLNPKRKVPTLVRDDGSVLTEWGAIATWIARSSPPNTLIPEDIEQLVRAREITDYVVATLHMQGVARIWRPEMFSPGGAEREAVIARGYEILHRGLKILDRSLAPDAYAIGEFCLADAALFYLEYWVVERLHETLPTRCAAHYRRMRERPAVQRAMATEGLT